MFIVNLGLYSQHVIHKLHLSHICLAKV